MAHSKKFESVKKYYDLRMWSRETVAKAVSKGWITKEEYKEITGEVYVG